MTSTDAGSAEPAGQDHDYVRSDWNRYRQLDTLINHWNRPGWTNGRRSYHWIVRFDDHPAVRQLTTRCQDRLRHLPTLDLVPATSLHLTLQRVGFTDEITPATAHAVAAAARDRYAALPPFAATVGPLAGSAGAVRFSAGPHQPFHRLRDTAIDAVAQVRGLDAVPARTADFLPHVSIAYNSTATDAMPIIEQVAALRSLEPVTVPVEAVDLVELRRDGRAYAWRLIATAPLTGTATWSGPTADKQTGDPWCDHAP